MKDYTGIIERDVVDRIARVWYQNESWAGTAEAETGFLETPANDKGETTACDSHAAISPVENQKPVFTLLPTSAEEVFWC